MAAARSLPFFVAGLLAYGCTSFISAPMNSYVTSLRGSWTVQRAVTFRAAAFQVGAIVGPILGGWIANTAGLSNVFRYSAGLFLASTLVMSLARRPLVLEHQEASIHLVSPIANPRFLGLLAVVFFTIIAISVPQQLTSLYLARWSESVLPDWHTASLRRGTLWQSSLRHWQRESSTITGQRQFI